ncbi:MAG: 1-deoxy-D-xylulose-5-phosphate synthase, partial [Victivallales bacterium]|nr:1-deoxy-D-xylulose-5-phosphate synthase [Victivallales bacterium]
ARDAAGTHEKVVAIVGDGALNCGLSLEGLNNVRETTRDMIIILNDNKMSISENVGAIPAYLNYIISGRSYSRFKAMAKVMLHKIPHGDEIRRKISRLEEATKSIFVPGVFFEELGIRYIGPINGHDFKELFRTLTAAREYHRPVIVHVITEKGRGYVPAEAAPEKFHGVSGFNPVTGLCEKRPYPISFSAAFGTAAVELAERHGEVTAITAAMCSGTGLKPFAQKFPHRFHDVGIAEEHALVFAAGLAAGGLRPIVAIYSTFMQRALDCIFHDICLQQLPVIICQDRSGIVEDGPTHHGIHDLSFLRHLPYLTIMQPQDETELHRMLFTAYELGSPVVIRYPKGHSEHPYTPEPEPELLPVGKAQIVRPGRHAAIWALGNEVGTAEHVAALLADKGWDIAVVNPRFVVPFDRELLLEQAAQMPIVTIEDNQISGGLGSIADELLVNFHHHGLRHFGWGETIIPHGDPARLRLEAGLDAAAIAAAVGTLLAESGVTPNHPTKEVL